MAGTPRAQGLGEEIANGITHGVAALCAAAGLAMLLQRAAESGDVKRVAAVTVFGVTMILLFLSSTLYHSLAHNRAKRVFQVLDHASIYFLIAGTYTPFTMLALPGALGWIVFGVEWTLAVLGTTLEACLGARMRTASVVIYLAMGWLVVPLLPSLKEVVGPDVLWWVVCGGLFYTGGVVFYLAKRVRYAHMIWHLAVIGGSFAHFVAVYRFLAD